MVIDYRLYSSVEGNALLLSCRKYLNKQPKLEEKLNCIVFRFQLKDNAKVSIKKELNPKVAIINKDSLLNKGDGLKGEIISGFSVKPIKSASILPRTSLHRGQFVNTKKFSYSRLDREFLALREMKSRINSK